MEENGKEEQTELADQLMGSPSRRNCPRKESCVQEHLLPLKMFWDLWVV